VITTVPKSKAHIKPSQQTQFILDAMAEADSKMMKWWEQVLESADLLFSKLEAQEAAQPQMAVQVDLMAQAITHSTQDHQALVQQLAATTKMVTRLVVTRDAGGTQGVQGPQRNHSGDVVAGDTPTPNNRPAFGCNKGEDEVQFNCSVLLKLSFPKFSGDKPRIWVDKCYDYFCIFNGCLIAHGR
jgi:hypothetical protein